MEQWADDNQNYHSTEKSVDDILKVTVPDPNPDRDPDPNPDPDVDPVVDPDVDPSPIPNEKMDKYNKLAIDL